jgi:UDP-glucose 4-epimerase
MKRILITGANSYIGTSFEKYLADNYPEKYVVDTIDMVDGAWHGQSFHGYDSLFHVAGIAHSDSGKISQEKEKLYYEINTELTIETAKKAKGDGVKQFIFMSSAIVYGDSAPIGKRKVITKDTVPQPSNCYGDSKLQAENGILPLQSEDFNVVVLRPPMIYGKGCKGNYQTLVKLALKLPVFPYVKNERSMLYIENLCEFVRLMVENDERGIFWPQNAEYSNTSEMVKMIAEAHGKKIRLIKGFTWLLKVMSHFTGLVNKAFGSLVYNGELNTYKGCYNIYSLSDSMERIEQSK